MEIDKNISFSISLVFCFNLCLGDGKLFLTDLKPHRRPLNSSLFDASQSINQWEQDCKIFFVGHGVISIWIFDLHLHSFSLIFPSLTVFRTQVSSVDKYLWASSVTHSPNPGNFFEICVTAMENFRTRRSTTIPAPSVRSSVHGVKKICFSCKCIIS